MVNNVRDLETDRRAGKRTLAVRLGRARARALYALIVYLAFAHRAAGLAAGRRGPLPLAAAAVARAAARRAGRPRGAQPGRRPVAERRAGAKTGMLQLVFCVLLSAGLLLSN